ncbi:MAG: D-2-hydroxyacid dehydrogenase [Pigmentiphaga sp.]|uniref:D-2-hydroxyacid dehydrogenase n=1 Tax=Pigmentiphaga sp. TaxID=1977564 RepID=UPI0029AE62E8|nr:D-2-hydroxyacid dehydrogenase [Pigmentiphaga sp.]MDX3905927.1 D-2-hydroxyacid dehydrogenase [Pigmentiphaga sp.]
MRVIFSTRIARAPVQRALESFPGLDLVICEDLSEVAPIAAQADALILSDPRGAPGREISAAIKQPGSKVRWVQLLSAGAAGLLAHGVPAHVVVTNQGGAVAPAVAEHGMAMMLGMARRIADICERSARHEWNKEFSPPLVSLEGKTLAIVGFGNIGAQLAKRAAGFDMKVIGLSRSLPASPLAEMRPMEALDEALAQADVVALCIASSPATRHIMNAQRFAAIKPGAFFINLTRGETVDQDALSEALTSGRLASAFIDVTEPEPLPPDHPLWDAPNLFISPHTAGAGSVHTGRRIADVVSENLRRFMGGEPLLHMVKD